MKPQQKLNELHHYIESLCGMYTRIARRFGVDRSYVSRVARGERHSPEIETALVEQFEQVQEG